MTTLSLKKPLGFETKLTLDAAARGTVVERSTSKRVVVVDRPPARPHREAHRDHGARVERDEFEYDAPRQRADAQHDRPYRPEYRPITDFTPRAPQYGRGPTPRAPRADDESRPVPHLLWPPRVAPSDFDASAVTLPPIAAEPMELPLQLEPMLLLLRGRFPAAFPADPLPLRFGVEAELARTLEGTPEAEQLDDFLFAYRAHPAYLAALVMSERRFGLDGEPAERIEPEEREQALWTLRALDRPAEKPAA